MTTLEESLYPLLVVAGPTASGKTALALRLAEELDGEIVSCDSVAVYRLLEIGSAKPTAEERRRVLHHGIDLYWPDEVCTAGDYARHAREALAGIRDRGRIPIVTGGTGLYLRALLEGLAPAPRRDEALRERLRARAERRGSNRLHRLLQRLDPRAAALIHAHDVPKLIRSLEVTLSARRPQTEQWKMGRDPLRGFDSTNVSVLRPYGVWLVISPFNFPASLCGGPSGAALVAGNTLVMKPASDTPWIARLIADCLRDAGIPEGVFNYVTGPGSTVGQALIESKEVAGVTFTGSYDVGMKIFCDFCGSRWIRPTILEMGGKNPAIVSRNANLDDAAAGIVRSSFGLQGQKCSACSRVFIEAPVYDQLVDRLVSQTEKLVIGDPTERSVFLGPVINQNSFRDFQRYTEEISQSGRFLTGGKVLTQGEFSKGYFCSPTYVADLPVDHPLWKEEMFVPITTLARVDSLEEAMRLANDVQYGLTAGFYGSAEEVDWFFDQTQAGVTYANRPQGATTGAWPGFQPFGGWKGSGSTGKNSGGNYYLPLYMHEQIHTRVSRE